jgi:molecular chaperone GrpE
MKKEEEQFDENMKEEAAPAAPTVPADDHASCEEILATTQKERDEYLNGWQRARADFANYKKDEVERLTKGVRYATEDIVLDLLRVLDSFDLGLAALEKDGKTEKGMHMIRAQLEDSLKRRGLERIPITIGDPFDPAVAEAVGEMVAELPPGSIAEEIEPGYRLLGKVVRPARVRLAKGP